MSWNSFHLSGEHDFLAEFGSRAKIDRGAPGDPPSPPDRPTQTSHWLGLIYYQFLIISSLKCVLSNLSNEVLYDPIAQVAQELQVLKFCI